ncbi:MAG: TadE/TadG family type IV pilus assembly protein [Candidatus Acidiferrales bacterium]
MEFALIFLVLMTMILGIIDFCRAAYSYHFVSEAAREAKRYAAVRGSTCTNDGSCTDDGNCTSYATAMCVPTYVDSIAPPGIDASSTGCGGSGCLATTASWTPLANGPTICNATKNAPGCTVTVEVSYTFNFIFPLVRTGTLTLSSTSEMVIAH